MISDLHQEATLRRKALKKEIKMTFGQCSKMLLILGILTQVIGVAIALGIKYRAQIMHLSMNINNKTGLAFGIQIDSLADMVSFVFLPITIFYGLGYSSWYNVIIFAMFTLGGVIRLGYFNVIADEKGKDGPVKYYSGLPVTASAIIFPVVYILKHFIPAPEFAMIYTLTMLFIAILYVLNFKIKKPTPGVIYFFVFGGAVLSVVLYLLAR